MVNVVIDGRKDGGSLSGDADMGYVADDHAQPDRVDVSGAVANALRGQWANVTDVRDDISDDGSDEDLPYPILEDDEPEPGFVNWEAIETNSGLDLSAWDRLGEGYERDAAAIGKLWCNVFHALLISELHPANRLSEYDLAICRAFAYKVKTHTTDEDFTKVPYAFPTNPPLPKIDSIRSHVAFLAGIKPEMYECCANSCCCFVGPHKDLSVCPYCNEAQFRANGKPHKRFTYIPLIPRLVAFAGNQSMATKMQH